MAPFKKFIINLEQPCASMCTNSSGTLLAVVGRKGNIMHVHVVNTYVYTYHFRFIAKQCSGF